MKKYLICFIVTLFAANLFAQRYTPVDNGSGISFSIKNFGLNVSGSFKGLKGTINFDPASLPASSFVVSVDAASVNTGNGMRDDHLKKETYFDVEKYPIIHFESGKITNAAKEGTFMAEGKITIKGISKSVSFPFTATTMGDGYLFLGEFKLNRRDFGVGGSSMVMDDSLTVFFKVVAKKAGS